MKEDQTELITARLEHLQFMMEHGKMPIFRYRSDMFLFALEAYNIARSLYSRYYRLQEDLDIRFFVRFRFDYWLGEIRHWIEQLGGPEYRVEDEHFFAEGRAKRLTVVVNKLFGYHLDKLPADSAEGSNLLPDEEILEPFKAILKMKSVDLVQSFRGALEEVYASLQMLAMMPVEWSAAKRQEALRLYLEDASKKPEVQAELTNYRYFCCMPDAKSVKNQFCYLKQRLMALASAGELAQLKVAKCDQDACLNQLSGLFGKDETNPSADQIPCNAKPMADEALFAKFLYFVNLDDEHHFPVLDADKVLNYLIRKDVYLDKEQELHLQALFALMAAMRQHFDPIIEMRLKGSRHGAKMQARVQTVLTCVKRYNSMLRQLLERSHEVAEIDTFFDNLLAPSWREVYGAGQDDLLELLEKEHNGIKLETYVHLLREAQNTLGVFVNQKALGKLIYECLKEEKFVEGANENTVYNYFSKADYKRTEKWRNAIALVEAVEETYKQSSNLGI